MSPGNVTEYKAVLSPIERKAYAAAHRLLQLSTSGEREMACPGKRRSVYLDRVAAVIAEEFGEILSDRSANSALPNTN